MLRSISVEEQTTRVQKRILIPLDEQIRREDEIKSLEMAAKVLQSSINPDAPFRYDPPKPETLVLTLKDQERRSTNSRLHVVTTPRRSKRWGK